MSKLRPYIIKQLELGKEYTSQLTAHLVKTEFKLNDSLRNVYKSAKHTLVDLRRDPLEFKLRYYGNNGQWASYRSSELSRVIFNSKTPPNDGKRWCAVEIECIFPNERNYNSFLTECKRYGLRSNMQVKNDGSIKPTDDCDCGNVDDCDICGEYLDSITKEIAVFFPIDDMTKLKETCAALNTAKAYVNRSCGLHVHFDMRSKERDEAIREAHLVANLVPLLKCMLPESRRNNYYCAKTISTNSDRYAFVNTTSYNKYKTIEIRGHSGTTNFEKISNWIYLIDAIMRIKSRKINKELKSSDLTFGEMLYLLDIPKQVYDYAISRAKLFSPEKFTNKVNSNAAPVLEELSEVI